MIKSCVDVAMEKFMERRSIDSNPLIVQMLDPTTNEPISHWYYRSDDFIFQPDNFFAYDVTEFIGNINEAPERLYSKSSYIPSQKLMDIALKISRKN